MCSVCARLPAAISMCISCLSRSRVLWLFFFFFQAEDGIRDHCVTGVQTCALPISWNVNSARLDPADSIDIPRADQPAILANWRRENLLEDLLNGIISLAGAGSMLKKTRLAIDAPCSKQLNITASAVRRNCAPQCVDTPAAHS